MQRHKKEPVKASPAERLLDRWNQQVFFLKKQYPQAEPRIRSIQKTLEKKQRKDFCPTEEAIEALESLYADLKQKTLSL